MKKITYLILICLMMTTCTAGFATEVPVEPTPNYAIQLTDTTLDVEATTNPVSLSIPVGIEKDGITLTDEEVLTDPNIRLYVLADYSDGSDAYLCDVDNYSNGQAHVDLPTEGVIGYSLYIEALEENAWVQIRFVQPTINYSITLESNNIDIPTDESTVSVSVPVQIHKNEILLTDGEILSDPNIRLYILADYSDGSDSYLCDVDNYTSGQANLELPTEGVIGYSLYIEALEESVWVQIRFQPVEPAVDLSLVDFQYDQSNYILYEEIPTAVLDIPVRFYYSDVQLTDEEVLNGGMIQMHLEKKRIGESSYEYVAEVTDYQNGLAYIELPTEGIETYELVLIASDGTDQLEEGISIIFDWQTGEKPVPPPVTSNITSIDVDQNEYLFTGGIETVELTIPVRFMNGNIQLTDEEVLASNQIRMYLFKHLADLDCEYHAEAEDYFDGAIHLSLPTQDIDAYVLNVDVDDGGEGLLEQVFIRPESTPTTDSYTIQYIGNYESVNGELYLEQNELLQIRLIDDETNEDVTALHEITIAGIEGATLAEDIVHFPAITESWGYEGGKLSILVDGENQDTQSIFRYIGTLGHLQVLSPQGSPVVGEMNIYYALVDPEGSNSLYRNYSNRTNAQGEFYFPINTDRTNIAVFGFAVSPYDLDTPYANSTFVDYTNLLATSETVIDFGTVSLQEPHYIAKLVDQSGNPMPGMVIGDLNAIYEDPETGLSFRFIVKAMGYGDGQLAFANVFEDKVPPYQTDELVMWAIENDVKFEVTDFIMPAEFTMDTYHEPSVSLTGTLYAPNGNPVDPSMEFHVIARPINDGSSVSVWSNGPSYEIKGLAPGQYRVWAITEHEWQKTNNIALLDSESVIVDYDGISPTSVDLTMSSPYVMGTVTKDGVPLTDRELVVNLYNAEGRLMDDRWVMGSEFFLGSFNLAEKGDYIVEITNSTQDLSYGGQFISVHLTPGNTVDLGLIELQEAKVTGQILADGYSGSNNNMRGVYVNVFNPNGEFIKFAKTNSAGEFSVGNLLPGEYLLEAYVSPYANAANDFMSSKKELLVYDGNSTQTVSLELEPIAYTGLLTDPFGNGLENHWVKIFDENKNLLSIVKSGTDGTFAIPYLDGKPGWLQGLGDETYLESTMIRAEVNAILALQEANLFCQITNMTAPTKVILLDNYRLWMQTIDVEAGGSFRLGGVESGTYKICFITDGALSLAEEITISKDPQNLTFTLPPTSDQQVSSPIEEGLVQFCLDDTTFGMAAIRNGNFAVSDAVSHTNAWIFSKEGLERILTPEEWVGASNLDLADTVPFSGRIIGEPVKYHVYLYDENWNLLAMQKTNLLGEFTFEFVNPGIVHIDVYNGKQGILTQELQINGSTEVDLDVR